MNGLLISGIVAIMISSASCWNYNGHYLVARMAYDILLTKNPSVLMETRDLLGKMNDTGVLKYEDKVPFVECAALADQLRSSGWNFQASWHYVNHMLFDGVSPEEVDYVPSTENITSTLGQLVSWLKGEEEGYLSGYVYKDISKKYPDEEVAKSAALRMLIHYMGDIHQPLHNSERFGTEDPALLDGD
mmetsp:Transcript_11519/g.8425  ORF Transcript_11519/g.8425 Transcript_11519/m.8425 type:complete len:188 (+) Transcript_11519:3-566(+)